MREFPEADLVLADVIDRRVYCGHTILPADRADT